MIITRVQGSPTVKIDQIDRNRYRREGAWIAAIGVFALLLIVMITVDTLRKTASIGELREVAKRTSDIVHHLDQLSFDLTAVENAQRGYLLTHDEADEALYQQATGTLNNDMAEILALPRNPSETSLATSLADAVAAKQRQLSMIESTLRANQATGSQADFYPGRAETTAVNASIAAFRTAAETRLQGQEQQTSAVEDQTRRQIFLSIAIAAACIGLALFGTILEARGRNRLLKILDSERLNAIAANRTKSSFLAYTSHELRTPLNAIIGFSEFMMMEYAGPLSDRQKQYLGDIRGSGLHLQAIIGDILDLTKAEAGKITLSESEIDLGALIGSCLKLVEGQAKEAKVTIRPVMTADLPHLFADELRCKQVLINLAINAIKLTAQGGEVRLEAFQNDLGEIALEVHNTGPGIPQEDLPKMIEPYFRSGIEEPSHKGYGLGMPLARKIMQLHGGSLSLMSQPGEGTSAQIIFPLARVLMRGEHSAEVIPLVAKGGI
jgi:signal transduction histidine kinase